MRPKLKLLLILLIAAGIFAFTEPFIILAASAAAVSLIFAFRLQRNYFLWVKPLSLMAAAIILLQSFPPPIFAFSAQGVFFGILYAARFVTLLALIAIFVHTTGMSRLAEAFDFLPGSISQTMVLTLALLPRLSDLTEKIINAQKSRGHSFRSANIFRTYFPVLVPLFAKTLERSERMALAMQARGYDG